MEKVILVDKKDHKIGEEEKIEAHKKGLLHRSFSIFIFNQKGELLLQKRAKSKYHSGGLWSNTCCGHPRPNEEISLAASRRLKEEMGIKVKIKEVLTFIYKVKVGNDLVENEYDHLFVGRFDETPKINPKEVTAYKWLDMNKIRGQIQKKPKIFSPWFVIAFKKLN